MTSTSARHEDKDDDGLKLDDDDLKSIPAFLLKTFNMVSDPNTNHVVCWNDKGDGFIVKNEHVFATNVLPAYFRHRNFSSFVRQLNFYGFRKRSNKSSYSQFSHPLFLRGQVDKLRLIKRKTTEANMNMSSSNVKDAISSLQAQVSDLRDQYDHIWKIQHQILYILSQFVRGSPEVSAILNNVTNPNKRARLLNNDRSRRRQLIGSTADGAVGDDDIGDSDETARELENMRDLAAIQALVDSMPKGASILQNGSDLPVIIPQGHQAQRSRPNASNSLGSSDLKPSRFPSSLDTSQSNSSHSHSHFPLNSPSFASLHAAESDLPLYPPSRSYGGGVSITELPADTDTAHSSNGHHMNSGPGPSQTGASMSSDSDWFESPMPNNSGPSSSTSGPLMPASPVNSWFSPSSAPPPMSTPLDFNPSSMSSMSSSKRPGPGPGGIRLMDLNRSTSASSTTSSQGANLEMIADTELGPIGGLGMLNHDLEAEPSGMGMDKDPLDPHPLAFDTAPSFASSFADPLVPPPPLPTAVAAASAPSQSASRIKRPHP